MPGISSINVDVLLEIFRIHVLEHHDTPQRILRVNRRWNAIVQGAPTLWADLLMADKVSVKYHEEKHPQVRNKILCETPESLSRAIKRIGNAQFELTIMSYDRFGDLTWDGAVDATWFSRCRVLRIVRWGCWPKDLAPDFRSLECLDLVEQAIHLESEQDNLLQNVQRSGLHLRLLCIPSSLFSKTSWAFSRLQSLNLHLEEDTALITLKGMSCLERLSVSGYRDTRSLEMEEPYPSQLHHLDLKLVSPLTIPIELYANLRTLTLQLMTSQLNSTIELPRLVRLTFVGPWNSMIYLQAPQLQALALYSADSSNTFEMISQTTLRPKRLDLDLAISEKYLAQLLCGQWRDVENLTIVYVKPNQSLYRTLASAFLATLKTQVACPDLWQLTIISPEREETHKKRSEASMKAIWDARKGPGGLIHARYGWYGRRHSYGTYYDNPRVGKIRWSEMLDGDS